MDNRLNGITELDKNVNHDDLICKYQNKTHDENLINKSALNLINKIRNGKIRLAEAKNDQIKFKSNLGEIKKHTKIDQKRKKRAT